MRAITKIIDDAFGTHGQTVTPFGTPAVNGYITGMALAGNLLAVEIGRASCRERV